MAASANIFQQYLQAPKSVSEYRAELDTAEARQNALQAAAMDRKGKEQAMQDEQAYRGAVAESGGDQNALIKALNAQGLGTRAQAVQKSILESDQVRAEIGVKNSTTAKNTQGTEQASRQAHIQAAGMVQSPEDAMQWGAESVRLGIMTPEQFQQGLARIPSDPQGLQQWKAKVMQGGMTVLQQLESTAPKPQEVKLGNVVKFLDMNPRSQTFGKEVAPTQQMGQSPDNAASNARMAADNAASRALTARGQNMTDARGREGNALRMRELEMMGGPSSAPVLGVPAPAVAPWANQSNPKDANKVKANEQTRGAKEIEKDVDAARKAKDAAAAAKRFLELNKQTNTGGMIDRFGPTRALQSLGSNYSEMESITAKLAPAMRVEGSGSTSDFDGRQFERATVGVDKPGATNRNIAQGVIARAQQDEEYADFRQTYLEQNGTLQGADRYWKDYANKNPIFDPAKEGTFALNPRRKPWKEHFKAAAPAQQPASGGVVDFGSLK